MGNAAHRSADDTNGASASKAVTEGIGLPWCGREAIA